MTGINAFINLDTMVCMLTPVTNLDISDNKDLIS